MKWLAIALAVIAASLLIVAIVGALLPQSHVAVRSAQLRRPAADVWKVVTDVSASATWRTDIVRSEVISASGGRIVWREVGKHRAVTYDGELVRAPMPGVPGRFISRMTDTTLPYGGEWIIDVAVAGEGSVVTVTENGAIYNPFFRFISRFVLGHTTSIDGYLRALGRHFAEDVTPVEAAPV